MPISRTIDPVFQLVQSLEKSEKRNFKLYMTRNSSTDELKVIQLFDTLDKMEEYNETVLLKRSPTLTKNQLPNLKAHLFRQLLASLRLLHLNDNVDLRLHEQMDQARILYNKGLYLQSLKTLARLKDMARHYNQFTYLQQALFFEKKIEVLYVTRSIRSRANDLVAESEAVERQIALISKTTNLSLLLYSWYIYHGFARNPDDEHALQRYLEEHLPKEALQASGFYERLYLSQSYCWYAFIRQDFANYYRHSHNWVNLFRKEPQMLEVETAHYIKAMHNLMDAHFYLQDAEKLAESLSEFEHFCDGKLGRYSKNNSIQSFIFLSTARFNLHMLRGDFATGLQLVPKVEEQLAEYERYIDPHRVLVFYYKIACLHFGNGHYAPAIDYLNRIINWKTDVRNDLQCYARLLHLIAHYELKHWGLIEHLFKSVYRFMAKMETLSGVEEAIFSFFRRSFKLSAKDIPPALQELLQTLRQYEHNRYEARAFAYLDIISWIESKLAGVPVCEIIRLKQRLPVVTEQ
jgi:hypothetical protein